MLETSRPYVMVFPSGTEDRGMKKMVLVPLGMRVPTPCARRPKSLASARIQTAAFGPFTKSRYSSSCPVCSSKTALAWCRNLGVNAGWAGCVIRHARAACRGRRL